MTAGSSIFSGIAQKNQQDYSAAVAGQNAQLAEKQATLVEQQGVDEQTQLYRKVGATAGAQTAGFAAAGLDPTFGSAAQLITGTSVLGEEDAQRQRNNTINQVNGLMINASNYQAQDSADKMAGNNALIGGFLKAGSSIIGGASQIPGGGGGGASTFNGWYGSTGGG